MQYGEQVVLSDVGIRLSAKQLEMIGMGPESSCWGLWLPEWSGSGETNRGASTLPQHLVLSPFKVEMWPCLLRIVLKINDSHGALSRAIKCLVECGINTLSHHFTPCGHHHATYTLIGVPFRAWVKTGIEPRAMDIDDNKADEARAALAVTVLTEVMRLERKLLDDNLNSYIAHRQVPGSKDLSFLRMRYALSQRPGDIPKVKSLLPANERLPIGLVFDPSNVQEIADQAKKRHKGDMLHSLKKRGITVAEVAAVAKRAQSYAAKAVAIDWLQYPAFFALHGLTSGAMQFQFDAANDTLRPHAADHAKYKANLRKAVPEFLTTARAIACLDNRSNFIRVQPSRARGRPYLSVTVRHEFDPTRRRMPDGCLQPGEFKPAHPTGTRAQSDVKGSTGLLKHLTDAIRKAGGDVWHVKNIVGAMGTTAETSEIEFWLDEATSTAADGDNCPEPDPDSSQDNDVSSKQAATKDGAVAQPQGNPDCACSDDAPLNSPLAFNDRVRQCIEEKRAVIERLGVSMSVPVIRPVRSEHIFISTKYSFWHETRKTDVRAGVEELVHRYGYTVQCTPNDQPPHEPSIVLDVQKRITTAAGVVQILSKFDGWKDCNGSSMQWLLFEAGLARGSGVPLVYAVDAKDDDEINAWKNILRTHSGEAYFLFRSEFDGKTITEKIGHAIKHLDEIIRRPRGPEVWWH